MELFSEAASKETCFFYLRKGKLFIQLFWLLRFSVVAKKNTFSVEFLLPWKKYPEKKLKKKAKQKTTSWKCAILLALLVKKVTCNILKNQYALVLVILVQSFLKYDQLKWERQMNFIWKEVFVFGRQFVKVHSVIPFSKNLYHVETSKLTWKSDDWYLYMSFYLKVSLSRASLRF